jgi:hypothetical protein
MSDVGRTGVGAEGETGPLLLILSPAMTSPLPLTGLFYVLSANAAMQVDADCVEVDHVVVDHVENHVG